MASKAQRAQLVLLNIKGAKKFVCSSNQSGSSRDTATILQYTNVTDPNQSGSSWDRPCGTPIYYNSVSVYCLRGDDFLVLLFYILQYLLHRSTTYCYIGVLQTPMSLKAPCSG